MSTNTTSLWVERAGWTFTPWHLEEGGQWINLTGGGGEVDARERREFR